MNPAEDAPADPLVAELEAMLRSAPEDAGAAAQELVSRAIAEEPDGGRARLLALVDHLEGRAFNVSRALAVRGPEEARLLCQALEILDAVRDVGLPHIGEPPADVVVEVDREEKWLAELSTEARSTRDPEFREHLDRVLIHRLEKLADAPANEDQPGAGLRLIAEAVGDLLQRGQGHLTERTGRIRARLWRRIFERARPLEGRAAARFLDRLSDEINDRSEDILARAESLKPEAAIKLLHNARRDIRRVLTLGRHMDEPGRRRELRRMLRRVRAAIQDRDVRARQTAQVGPKTLRSIEVTVVAAIFAVLAIVGYDLFGSPSDSTRWTLAWVDAGICTFFLGEFAWRWRLSGWSGFYLWRCFFIDVLPSVPFGLIAELSVAGSMAARGEPTQTLRVIRAARLARGLRLVRPVFQFYRVMAFNLQGMDRLARRNADLLNRNIVLFDPAEDEEEGAVSVSLRLKRFRDRLARAFRLTLSELAPGTREPLAHQRLAVVGRRLERSPNRDLDPVTRPEPDLRDIRVEAVVEELLTLEAPTVEVHLGEESAVRLSRVLRMLDVPLIRRLPLIREMAAGTSELDPYQALTRAGHGLGRWLERIVERFRFLGDLTGIVTGSQLLDRIGTTLVKATQRPAIRLLMFGFAAVIVSWLISWLGSDEASALARLGNFFNKVLGPGVIVLGAACLLIQVFGRWIKRLAGETTELFEKVAEAHGINLVKFHKLGRRQEDLGLIFDRTLSAEARMAGDEDASATRAAFQDAQPHEVAGSATSAALPPHHEQVALLYLDYLDGAALHRSNVKSTEQFLGNLDIEAIRTERLSLSKDQQKRLRKLDLNRERSIPTGPYLWFRFITESLSQRVARLVLHYNRTAIPEAQRAVVPPEQVARMDAWLAGPRRKTTTSRPALDPWNRWWGVVAGPFILIWLGLSKTVRGIARLLRNVTRDEDAAPETVLGAHFNALHFMTHDPDRDAAVERTFGVATRRRLESDRKRMVREVFSSYPWEHLPRHRRTLNPLNLYFGWLGRGKVILLPLRVTWFWMMWWGRALRALGRLIAEQLRPEELRPERRPGMATLEVALRKINRMHLPVFMAALDLRARFDPEYLGLSLPGREPQPESFRYARDDLGFIGAREYRRERYRELRAESLDSIRRLERLLEDRGWPRTPLAEALQEETGAPCPDHGAEAIRAVTIAWLIDYRGCRSLITAPRDVRRAFESFLSNPGDARPQRRLRRRAHRRLLRDWITEAGLQDRDEHTRGLLRRAFASNRGRVRSLLQLLAENGGAATARRQGLETLAAVARHPQPWTRQLVSLRAIQTLCVLDILNTRRAVGELGAYGD